MWPCFPTVLPKNGIYFQLPYSVDKKKSQVREWNLKIRLQLMWFLHKQPSPPQYPPPRCTEVLKQNGDVITLCQAFIWGLCSSSSQPEWNFHFPLHVSWWCPTLQLKVEIFVCAHTGVVGGSSFRSTNGPTILWFIAESALLIPRPESLQQASSMEKGNLFTGSWHRMSRQD